MNILSLIASDDLKRELKSQNIASVTFLLRDNNLRLSYVCKGELIDIFNGGIE